MILHRPSPVQRTCPPQNNYLTTDKTNTGKNKINQLIDATKDNAMSINELKKTLSDLRNKSDASYHVLNNILLRVEELVSMQNITSVSPLPKSCQEIKQRKSTSPSGVYLIAISEKEMQNVYCNMETLCDSDGGWTRLAHINMTDPAENCPGGLRLYDVDKVRACGRPVNGGGSCHSIKYPSHSVRYNQVCGRVRGYQYCSPDSIYEFRGGVQHHNNINSYYVDGVSLTRGAPRQHIWTFIAGIKEDNSQGSGKFTCPCQSGSKQ